MKNEKKITEFIQDYQTMQLWQMADKWIKQYNDIPYAKDILTYLLYTDQLSLFGKTEELAKHRITVVLGTIVAALQK